MKKALSLLLSILLILGLGACGEQAPALTTKSSEPTQSTSSSVSLTSEVLSASVTEASEPTQSSSSSVPPTTEASSAEETKSTTFAPFIIDEIESYDDYDKLMKGQNIKQNLNLFHCDSSWFYGPWAGTSASGEIVKVRFDHTDWTTIDDDTGGHLARCEAVAGGYIYYGQEVIDDAGAFYELTKVRSSGEGATVIVPQYNVAQLVGKHIYYTSREYVKEDGSTVTEDSAHLYRCDLNGKNIELIFDSPTYCWYVFNDKILYQKDRDNESLHIYDLESQTDFKVNDTASYCPIFDGEYIYYAQKATAEDSTGHELWRVKPDGTDNVQIDVGCYIYQLCVIGDKLYFLNCDDMGRIYRCDKEGDDLELVTQTDLIAGFQPLGNALIYTHYSDEGGIDGIFLCDLDGGDTTEFTNSDEWWYY